jgi:diadenosine tetraphosphate (Ap4A) HIT family hydrolase
LRKCDFCDEFSSGRHNAYARRYAPQPAGRILFDGPFHVLPTLGQIVEGHLLIIPIGHVRALAGLPNEQLLHLEDLCRQVRSVLHDVYGNCVFFEYGIKDKRSGGCGIDHAHMHAVPVTAKGVLNFLIQEFGGARIDSLVDIERESGQNSYLFFEDASQERYVFSVDNLPSQYMRKLVAESIGKSDWDWRKCSHEPALISTVQRLSPFFLQLGTNRRG